MGQARMPPRARLGRRHLLRNRLRLQDLVTLAYDYLPARPNEGWGPFEHNIIERVADLREHNEYTKIAMRREAFRKLLGHKVHSGIDIEGELAPASHLSERRAHCRGGCASAERHSVHGPSYCRELQ